MAALTKFDCLTEHLAEGRHNLAVDALALALTNTAPSAGNAALADLVEVSYTHCSSRAVTVTSSGLVGSVYTLVLGDVVLTASGGSVGPFRYVALYNSSAAGGPLIGWADLGSSVTIGPAV